MSICLRNFDIETWNDNLCDSQLAIQCPKLVGTGSVHDRAIQRTMTNRYDDIYPFRAGSCSAAGTPFVVDERNLQGNSRFQSTYIEGKRCRRKQELPNCSSCKETTRLYLHLRTQHHQQYTWHGSQDSVHPICSNLPHPSASPTLNLIIPYYTKDEHWKSPVIDWFVLILIPHGYIQRGFYICSITNRVRVFENIYVFDIVQVYIPLQNIHN